LIHAIAIGVPMPAFSSALSFYDGYRTERLPANLLQAQRDLFGAHTYERVDKWPIVQVTDDVGAVVPGCCVLRTTNPAPFVLVTQD
jgi:hypothetical protein